MKMADLTFDELNDDQQDKIEEISRKTNMQEDTLVRMLNNAIESMDADSGSSQEVDNVLSRLEGNMRPKMRSSGEEFVGLVLGQGTANNLNERPREVAKKLHKVKTEGVQVKLHEGTPREVQVGPGDKIQYAGREIEVDSEKYYNDQGQLLNIRKEWGSGAEDQGFGEPLRENWIRNVYGVAMKADDDSAPRFFEMTMNGQRAKEGLPKSSIGVPVSFYARVSEKDEEMFSLDDTDATEFRENDDLELTVEEALEDIESRVVDVGDLADFDEQSDSYANVVIRGTAVTVEQQSNRFYLSDFTSDTPARVIPRGTASINFGEGSEVVAVGGLSIDDNPDEEDYDQVAMVLAGGIHVENNVTGEADAGKAAQTASDGTESGGDEEIDTGQNWSDIGDDEEENEEEEEEE